MPNKTIYVADGDLPICERAQELAGANLSATIVQALRRFVATEDARTQGYTEVSLKVGSQGAFTTKRFLARELARRRTRDQKHHRIETRTVYQTAKGRLVLHTRGAPDWTAWSASWNWDWDADAEHGERQPQRWGQDWSAMSEGGEQRMTVYETLDDLTADLDDSLCTAVEQALRGEEDEFLDI